ncbi:replicative DNA helicase [Peptostreptococcus canis]|uniref:Replicative DNA helicase n=1 Tax=Peptostreptococcus canis TaxID=1159213 RepID=A0ABR6TNN4_9FIRM|nr:replicative DNA helicase [Peptostreptococcus canis]MBC2576848.1 replicative DNA helicase [Peptostreptococcus canis]MBP1998931.1 replicative DNA helicase [Peptostreptococcus canis]
MSNISKVPPNSLESEQSVIGAILTDSDSIIPVIEVLDIDDFYSEAHRVIFDCMLELNDEKSPIDIVTVSSKLRNRESLDTVGGMNYLTSMMTMVPTTSNVKYYAEVVKEKSTLRKLIKASNDIINIGYDEESDIDDILNIAEKKIFDISQERTSEDFKEISKVLGNVLDNIEKVYASGSDLTGLNTGFEGLNKKLSGFHNSDLILVAARPGMGKTAFSLNLVLNAAIKSNASVAVFSLEMSKEQLVQRLISSQSMVSMKNISNGKIADEEWNKIMDALSVLSSSNIYIDDTPGIKASEIRSKCRKLKLEKGLDMIMIDYLQLMEGDGRAESRQQEVSKISRSLKILAKEMNCPVIALSQLSRNTESGKDHKPKLSDLRDSGAIEQDADIVMFIYRDEYYNEFETKKKNIAEIIIAKNRHGETGEIELVWMGEFQKFTDKQKSI